MRLVGRVLLGTVLLIAARGPLRAGSTPAPSRPDDPEAGRKLDDLLTRWEARSRTLRTLSVKFKRVDASPLFNEKHAYTGQIRIQGPDRVYLEECETRDGKPGSTFSDRLICDGKDLYQFTGPTKRVWIWPGGPGFARGFLEFGPLAFLHDVEAAAMRERFDLTILREDADTYMLRAVPKGKSDRSDFSRILIKLDKRKLLPVAIRLETPGGSDTKTYTCSASDLIENPTIPPSWFDGRAMADGLRDKGGWAVVTNPGMRILGVGPGFRIEADKPSR